MVVQDAFELSVVAVVEAITSMPSPANEFSSPADAGNIKRRRGDADVDGVAICQLDRNFRCNLANTHHLCVLSASVPVARRRA